MKMSKGLKNFMIVCAIVLAIGLVLSAIGFAMGGISNISPSKGFHISWFSDSVGDMGKIEQDFESFDSIDIESALADINLIPSDGDKYRVECNYFECVGKPDIYVEDGTLFVKRMSDGKLINLDLSGLIAAGDGESYINVYYPKDKVFTAASIDSDMGDVNVKNINSDELTINSAAGDVDMSNANVDKIDAKVDMGSIEGDDVVISKESNLETAAGDITLTGEFRGENSMETDFGEILLETSLAENDYNYDIETDMGDVYIAGGSVSHDFEKDNCSANILDLKTGAGDVKVSFR